MSPIQKPPQPELLVAEFCDFLRQAGKARSTIRNRRGDIHALIRWFESGRRSPFDVESFVASGIEDYREWLRSHFKVSTVNRRLTSLNIFLRWASESKILRKREYSIIRIAPLPIDLLPVQRATLDKAEQTQLIERVESSGDLRGLVIIRLMLDCGLRVSEICALEWGHVILAKEDATLSVRSPQLHALIKVPLPDKTCEALAALRQSQASEPTCHVLTGRTGSISPRAVEMTVTRLSRRSGLADVTAKILRRSYVMNIFTSGMDYAALTALLGNRIMQLTREYISIQLTASLSDVLSLPRLPSSSAQPSHSTEALLLNRPTLSLIRS